MRNEALFARVRRRWRSKEEEEEAKDGDGSKEVSLCSSHRYLEQRRLEYCPIQSMITGIEETVPVGNSNNMIAVD